MTTIAYEAVKKLISDKALIGFALNLLLRAGEVTTRVSEYHPTEITFGDFCLTITWDYITIVNCTNNEVVHSTSSAEEVKEFLYNYYKGE